MIYGKLLRLRAVEPSDLPRFVAWLNDPEVIRGLLLYLPLSMREEEEWFEAMLKRPKDEHPLVMDVRRGDAWQAIGNIGLHNLDWRTRAAEVGIFIGEKSLWSQGLGGEAMRLMLRHGFNTLNLNRIYLRVFSDNPRAIRSYEKVGFVLEGRMRQAQYLDGQYVDELIMSVLRSEWDAGQI